MRVNKPATTLIILIIFLGGNVNAQTPLNLNQAIELGLKNNQQIQANELNIKAQNQLKPTAKELPKTKINAMLGQYNTRSFDQNYSISQEFNPFQFQAKKELINANIKNSELELLVTKQDVTSQIRRSWNMISYYLALNNLLQKQEEYLQIFVKAATLKFKTGESSLLEKITAETKQQALIQTRKQNEGMILSEKIKLKSILNLKGDIVLFEDEFLPVKAFVADSVYINQNSVLVLATQQIGLANANKNVEKAQRKPDFIIGYFIQSLTGNQDIEGNNIVYYNGKPRFQGVNLGITVPLFGKASKARVQASKTVVLVQQKNAEYLKNQLSSQLLQQIEEQKVNQSLIDYHTKTALPNAEIISKNAQKSFQNGEIGYVEYLQSLETVLKIEQNYLNVINQFNQNNINIQYLLNN